MPREKLFITTKYTGRDNLTLLEAGHQSIKKVSVLLGVKLVRSMEACYLLGHVHKLGVDQVDLYLIHHPRFATPDFPTAWAQMEKLKADGLTKCVRFPSSCIVFVDCSSIKLELTGALALATSMWKNCKPF